MKDFTRPKAGTVRIVEADETGTLMPDENTMRFRDSGINIDTATGTVCVQTCTGVLSGRRFIRAHVYSHDGTTDIVLGLTEDGATALAKLLTWAYNEDNWQEHRRQIAAYRKKEEKNAKVPARACNQGSGKASGKK